LTVEGSAFTVACVRIVLIVAAALFLSGSAGADQGPIQIPLGHGPTGLAVAHGALWVTIHRDGIVDEIDPGTNRIEGTVRIRKPLGSIVVAGGALWTVDGIGVLQRIDPATRKVRAFDLLHYSGGVAYGLGSLWLWDQSRHLDRLNLRGIVTARYTLPTAVGSVGELDTGSGNLWIASETNVLARLNPRTGKVLAKAQVFPTAQDEVEVIAGTPQGIWTTENRATELDQLDPATGQVVFRMPLTYTGSGEAFPYLYGDNTGAVWLQTDPGVVQRLGPAGAVVQQLTIPTTYPADDYWDSSVVQAFGSIWVTSWPGMNGPTDPTKGFIYRYP
jgi:streptogramin lyase